ncbi:MAG: hypothetical protein SGPRY_008702 [Prymnesium sp.]
MLPFCSRALCRSAAMESPTSACPGPLPHLPSVRALLQAGRGEERALDEALRNATRGPREQLEPHFEQIRQAVNAQCTSPALSSQRVAVLISGAARTMLEPGAVRELGELMLALRRATDITHVFAFLNTQTDERTNCRTCWANTSEVLRGLFFKWETLIEIEEYTPEHSLLQPSAADCSSSFRALPPQLQQFRKIAAASTMMMRSESRNGWLYTIVLRIRPDLCLASSSEFIWYGLRRAGCQSTDISYVAYDALAVLPRVAAEAYAAVWRLHPGCQYPDKAWLRDDPEWNQHLKPTCIAQNADQFFTGGYIPYGFMYAAAGLQSLDLKLFWSRKQPPSEPMLRRSFGWFKTPSRRPMRAGCYPFA